MKMINFVGYLITGHLIVCGLQVEQYSNKLSARVVCFEGTKTFRGTLTQPRPDVFGIRQQSGEYLLQILYYPPLVCILPSKLEVKIKKIKKRFSSQNLKLLDHVHSICVAVSQKKSGCGDLFWGKSSLDLLS